MSAQEQVYLTVTNELAEQRNKLASQPAEAFIRSNHPWFRLRSAQVTL
jgi:hypothetical protein